MIKKVLIMLILFGMILSITTLTTVAGMEQRTEQNYLTAYYVIWNCSYCGKEIKLPSYFNPRNPTEPYYYKLTYGCPKNKVEGTHEWIIVGKIYY